MVFLPGGWALCFPLHVLLLGRVEMERPMALSGYSPIKRFHCSLLVALFAPGSISSLSRSCVSGWSGVDIGSPCFFYET